MGAIPGFGVQVLLEQKSLKKLNGAPFFSMVQKPANTALGQGVIDIRLSASPVLNNSRASLTYHRSFLALFSSKRSSNLSS